jgi:hypothetical protein
MNIVCDDDMEDISEIEVNNGRDWYSYSDADDFVIRVKESDN